MFLLLLALPVHPQVTDELAEAKLNLGFPKSHQKSNFNIFESGEIRLLIPPPCRISTPRQGGGGIKSKGGINFSKKFSRAKKCRPCGAKKKELESPLLPVVVALLGRTPLWHCSTTARGPFIFL